MTDYQKIARQWRSQRPDLARKGFVLIWDGEPYGWRDRLRDASTERPGAVAVDTDGRLFIAEGGDDQSGAKCWVVQD